MRILISAVGTRGDIQPAIALALALRDLGQTVRMCVPPNFIEAGAELGIEVLPIGVEMRAPRPGAGPQAPVPDLITDQFATVGSAADGCDLIVGAGVHQYAARSVAERRGLACVVAAYAPVSLPSPHLAPAGHAEAPGDPAETLRLWADERRRWNQRSLERVNTNRARLGLAPVGDVFAHILGDRPWLAADAVLGPAPSTPDLDVVQTGAWILPDISPLAAELEAFLQAGEPPVYLGFGSMPVAEGTSRTLIDAVRAVGRRVILSQGWAGLGLIDEGSDGVAIDEVNHQALFPRVAAVVHHGGAGTTTTAALAGAPQVVLPMFSDQFYWARRVRELGVGATTPAAGLNAETLALALDQALASGVADRARALAGQVSPGGALTAARRIVEIFG